MQYHNMHRMQQDMTTVINNSINAVQLSCMHIYNTKLILDIFNEVLTVQVC